MLDRNAPEPLYIQLDRILRNNITSGLWKPGSAVPSENELCREYNISRMTARSVLTGLVREGLLYRVQGKGTFVPDNKVTTRSPGYLGIREQLEAQGFRIETRLLSFEEEPASPTAAAALSCMEGEPLFIIKRLRLMNGTPISIHHSYLPVSLCQGLSKRQLFGERQLCTVMEEDYGLTAAKVQETLESVLASKKQAELLDISAKSPLLLLEEMNYNSSGKVFEYSRIWFRGDKMKLHFVYEKE